MAPRHGIAPAQRSGDEEEEEGEGVWLAPLPATGGRANATGWLAPEHGVEQIEELPKNYGVNERGSLQYLVSSCTGSEEQQRRNAPSC